MGRITNVDPNFVLEQQRLAQMKALKQAKNAGAISGKKALWIIVPVFVIAVVLVLLFSGAFSKSDTVFYHGELYKITDNIVYELPEGYEEAGALTHADDPRKAGGDLTTTWNLEAKLYVDPSNPKKAYISAYGAYLEIKK